MVGKAWRNSMWSQRTAQRRPIQTGGQHIGANDPTVHTIIVPQWEHRDEGVFGTECIFRVSSRRNCSARNCVPKMVRPIP